MISWLIAFMRLWVPQEVALREEERRPGDPPPSHPQRVSQL